MQIKQKNLKNVDGINLLFSVWLANDSYDYISEDNYISATQLLKPTRQIILSMRSDADIDIRDRLAVSTGTAIHDSVEKAWMEHYDANMRALGYSEDFISKIRINPKDLELGDIPVYIEHRAVKELNGFKIGGKFDFVLNGNLHDIKTSSTYTYMEDSKREDYILQGSIYRYLNQDIITGSNITIDYFFTDWSKINALSNSQYPQSRCLSKSYPLLSVLDTEKYLKTKLREIKTNLNKPEDEIIPCPDKDLWLSPTVYKYYSDPTKINGRATKNFNSLEEANNYAASKGKGIVKTVLGTPRRCMYCPAYSICSQRRRYYND